MINTRCQIHSHKAQGKVPSTNLYKNIFSSRTTNVPQKGNKIFDDASIQNLWDAGIKSDFEFHKIYRSI